MLRRVDRAGRESEHERVRRILELEFLEALQRRDSALFHFQDVSTDIPSGLPNPDGKQTIYNASKACSASQTELMRALKRPRSSVAALRET